MSTDIHICVEVRMGGAWLPVLRSNPRYGTDPDEPEELLTGWLWDGQDYDLFAVMADVRNRHGFAGTDRGDAIVPVSMPRGLPEDVSDMVAEESDYLGGSVHSRSWLTLRELLDYDWDQTVTCRGWVGEEGYEDFKRAGRPRVWCGAIASREVVEHVSNQEMEAIIAGEMPRKGGRMHRTKVEWERKLRDMVGHFLDDVLPVLGKLGEPDDVRLVFWFDS